MMEREAISAPHTEVRGKIRHRAKGILLIVQYI